MSLDVARESGAETARLDELEHCLMAEAPELVAPELQRSGHRWISADRRRALHHRDRIDFNEESRG